MTGDKDFFGETTCLIDGQDIATYYGYHTSMVVLAKRQRATPTKLQLMKHTILYLNNREATDLHFEAMDGGVLEKLNLNWPDYITLYKHRYHIHPATVAELYSRALRKLGLEVDPLSLIVAGVALDFYNPKAEDYLNTEHYLNDLLSTCLSDILSTA